jgi:hypothetical protein
MPPRGYDFSFTDRGGISSFATQIILCKVSELVNLFQINLKKWRNNKLY